MLEDGDAVVVVGVECQVFPSYGVGGLLLRGHEREGVGAHGEYGEVLLLTAGSDGRALP